MHNLIILINKELSMAKRRKEKRTYKYSCNLTGEEYTLTKKVDNPDNLMSVKAYYEMNPDDDDRPEDVKKLLNIQETAALAAAEAAEEIL
jgi:hypothetical protein